MGFVRTVRVMLGFEAYGCSLWIDNSILSFDGSVEEITGVKLDAWFICIDFESNAGDWTGQLGG